MKAPENTRQLYSYYRSSAAYRVRIALNYKKLAYDYLAVDLVHNGQHSPDYQGHNPQGRVPTLVDNGIELGQSMAILEYLEERYPQPALLPVDINARAWVRYFAQIIVSDIHPLNNSCVLKFLTNSYGLEQTQITQWYHHWLQQGFDALEVLLINNKQRGCYCWGDVPTLADICLIPQVYNAHRFEFSLKNYPAINKINEYCLQQPFFMQAIPENQPDYIER